MLARMTNFAPINKCDEVSDPLTHSDIGFLDVFFFVLRMVFVVYHLSFIRLENIPTGEVVMAFVKSLKLDLSTASYIGLLSFVLLCVFLVVKQRWLLGLLKLVQWLSLASRPL